MKMIENKYLKTAEVINCLPQEIRNAVLALDEDKICKMQEIRLSIGCPVMVYAGGIYFLNSVGTLTKNAGNAIVATAAMVQKTVEKVCRGSLYSQQSELKCGFLMMEGGHRVGVCGKTVVRSGKVDLITDISSINIRIATQVIGAADKIINHIAGGSVANTLIISPPLCGKTTILRDIARQLAGEKYMLRVGIADERGEIAAMHKGRPQNDVGILSDVYDACPKSEGITMLLRAMAPDVIITDEIGTADDEQAIKRAINAGVKIICSAHGFDRADVLRREGIGTLIRENVFERVIILSRREGAGTIERIY